MARAKNQVSVVTFLASVDARVASLTDKERRKPAAIANAFQAVREVYEGEDTSALEAEIKAGKDHLKAQENEGKSPKRPGRKVSDEVMAVIRTHFKDHVDAFENGTLDAKTRQKILTSARALASVARAPQAAAAELSDIVNG